MTDCKGVSFDPDAEKEDELKVLCNAGNAAAATSLSLEPSNFMVCLSFFVQNFAIVLNSV